MEQLSVILRCNQNEQLHYCNLLIYDPQVSRLVNFFMTLLHVGVLTPQ